MNLDILFIKKLLTHRFQSHFYLFFLWTTEYLITVCEVEQLQWKGFILPQKSLPDDALTLSSGVEFLLGRDNPCWPEGKRLTLRESYSLLYVCSHRFVSSGVDVHYCVCYFL